MPRRAIVFHYRFFLRTPYYGAGFLRKLSCFFISSRIFKLSGVALDITGGMPDRFRFFSLLPLPAAG